MAEPHQPVLHGELREMIGRIDERISSLDRNVQNVVTDLRQIRNWIIGLYLFVLSVGSSAMAIYKLFPNPQ